MGFSAAAVAIKFSAGTGDSAELHHVGFDAEIGASFIGAVADVLVLQCIAHTCLFSVELAQLRGHHLYKSPQDWGFWTARYLHAGGENAASLQLFFEIPSPALRAVGVWTEASGVEGSMC